MNTAILNKVIQKSVIIHLSFDIDNLCAVYKSPYLAKEHWPECNICNQWFHECFFMAQS